MITKQDLLYVCTNLSNLTGAPVRLYKSKRLLAFYSTIHFPIDPFEYRKEEATKLKQSIAYYQTPNFYYYGIVNAKDLTVVVAPTRQLPIGTQELREIAFSLGVPAASMDDFVQATASLTPFPLMSLLQILCVVNYAITGDYIVSWFDSMARVRYYKDKNAYAYD